MAASDETTADQTAEQADSDALAAVRRARVELGGSMHLLRQAVAAPVDPDAVTWAAVVDEALAALAGEFGEHVRVTEGPGGLHEEIVETAPRLANAVARLAGEHGQLADAIDDLRVELAATPTEDAAAGVRAVAHDLLERLTRHRRRGADLVYEAYESDIGGET